MAQLAVCGFWPRQKIFPARSWHPADDRLFGSPRGTEQDATLSDVKKKVRRRAIVDAHITVTGLEGPLLCHPKSERTAHLVIESRASTASVTEDCHGDFPRDGNLKFGSRDRVNPTATVGEVD